MPPKTSSLNVHKCVNVIWKLLGDFKTSNTVSVIWTTFLSFFWRLTAPFAFAVRIFFAKALLLSFMEKRKSHGFRMTWGWINDDRTFIYHCRSKGQREGGKWLCKTKLWVYLVQEPLTHSISGLQGKNNIFIPEAHLGLTWQYILERETEWIYSSCNPFI